MGGSLNQPCRVRDEGPMGRKPLLDRKSTRLNSSHVKISYAVVCLKKKTGLVRSASRRRACRVWPLPSCTLRSAVPRYLHSFPTRRSSDLERSDPHTGTETRTRLLREAAVGNIGQWAGAGTSHAAGGTRASWVVTPANTGTTQVTSNCRRVR